MRKISMKVPKETPAKHEAVAFRVDKHVEEDEFGWSRNGKM